MKTVKQDKELHALIDEIYETAYGELGYNAAVFAAKAGLCHRTVLALENYDTMYPRFTTVVALARAAGFRMAIVRQRLIRRTA